MITKKLDYFIHMDEIRIYLLGKRKMDLPERFYKYFIFERETINEDGVIAEYLFCYVQKDAGFLYYSS